MPVELEINVQREYRLNQKCKPFNFLKAKTRYNKKHNIQYRKPNLPKESMSEADDEGKSHSQFQARIETITENGKEVKTIPITKHLAEWLSQIEAKEGYDDIIDRLLKGSEVPVNLNVPIKRVLVSLVK